VEVGETGYLLPKAYPAIYKLLDAVGLMFEALQHLWSTHLILLEQELSSVHATTGSKEDIFNSPS
jgi:hypothetical protein